MRRLLAVAVAVLALIACTNPPADNAPANGEPAGGVPASAAPAAPGDPYGY